MCMATVFPAIVVGKPALGLGVQAELPPPPPVQPARNTPAADIPSYVPRKGLVALWRAEGNANDSLGRCHGKLVGDASIQPGRGGHVFHFDGSGDWVEVADHEVLRITGDQPISMWICPDGYVRNGRVSLLEKAYGGECAILWGGGAKVTYLYGTAGHNGEPCSQFATSAYLGLPGKTIQLKRSKIPLGSLIKPGKWAHIAIVRNLTEMKLRWYVNGIPIVVADAPWPAAKASNRPLIFGKGYERDYAGLIDDVAIWNRALTPAEIRRVAQSTPFGVPYVERQADADRVELTDGQVLSGTIRNGQFTVTTSFGKVTVPAARVVGLVQPTEENSGLHLVLTDGQVLVGQLSEPLTFETSDGQTREITLSDIRQAGYRTSGDKPVEPAVSEPVLVLADGNRLIWRNEAAMLHFQSLGQTIALPSGSVQRVEVVEGRPNTHRVYFANGSILTGTLGPAKLALKPELVPDLEIDRAMIHLLQWPIGTVDSTGLSVLALPGGDRLYGRLTEATLNVRTEDGMGSQTVAHIRSITHDKEDPSRLAIKLWDHSVIKGVLDPDELSFVVAGGLTVKLESSQIITLTRPVVTPPKDWVSRVEALVKQLGSEVWKEREAAHQRLAKMPREIVPILKKYLDDKDLEIRHRVERIIATLEGPGAENSSEGTRTSTRRVLRLRIDRGGPMLED